MDRMTAGRAPEAYLFVRPDEDEEAWVLRNLIKPGRPIFDMVARLAARRELASLELLYSGSTPLHAIVAEDEDFRGDEGFADRAGPPFKTTETAAAHAMRALAGLGLALAAAEPIEEPLRAALAWYTEARGSLTACSWTPREAAGGQPWLLRLAELLADNIGDDRSAGAALTAAVTLRALAYPAIRRGRQTGVTVLLVTDEDKGMPARLKMSAAKGLPPGLVPDPEQMSLFAADLAFQQSLDRAWSQAGRRRAGGTALWSIEEAEGPSRQINGESAGAAFAVALDEIGRFSGPLAEVRVIRRLRSSNAVVGRIDDLGFMQGVGGYDGKIGALGEHARVIIPAADTEKATRAATKDVELVPVPRWKEAARKARRSNGKVILGQALAAAVVVGLLIVGIETKLFSNDINHGKQTALSRSFATRSDGTVGVNLRDADLYALAAWETSHTPEAWSSLLSREADPYLGSFPEPANFIVSAMAISPDSRLLAVGGTPYPQNGRPSSVQLWDIATHRLLAAYPVSGDVENVAFSADGTTLAELSTTQESLRTWSVSTHRELPDPVAETDVITSMAYSPDGRQLAIGALIPSKGTGRVPVAALPAVIDLWDLTTHRLVRRLGGLAGPVWALDFSDDGRLLASGGEDHAVRLWDTVTWRQRTVLTGTPTPVKVVQFEPGGSLALAAAGTDGSLRLWYTNTRTLGMTYGGATARGIPPAFAFSPGEPYLYTVTDLRDVSRVSLFTGRIAGDPIRTQLAVTHMAFSPDGRILVLGGPAGSLAALDIGGDTFYNPDGSSLTAAAVDRGGLLAATGTADGNVQVWLVHDPVAPVTWSAGQDVVSAAFSPDGWRLAAGTNTCHVLIWDFRHDRHLIDLNNARRIADLAAPGASGGLRILRIAFSPDGKTLATYCSNNSPGESAVAMLWDARTFRLLAVYRPPGALGAGDMALSPNGHTLALDTGTGPVLLWDTRLRRVTGQISVGGGTHLALAFSPDGQLLAISGTDGTVRLWNMSTRAQIAVTSANTSQYRYLAFSPDGSTLAATSQDTTVRIWQVPSLQLIGTLSPPTLPLATGALPESYNGLAYTPDGRMLVTAGSDGTAQIWDLNPSDMVRNLCGALRGPQLASQWQQLASGAGPDPCSPG
jgi:WD40 repeat protein